VAADADAFTTKLAAVLGQVLAVPALIVYCMYEVLIVFLNVQT
jgi:hypothetical protein